MSKARLKERHQGFLKNKLNELKMEVGLQKSFLFKSKDIHFAFVGELFFPQPWLI